MRILFAAPDRDLLECCKRILEDDVGETVTAFDGTQVLSLLAAEDFDIVLLDRALPRIGHKTLLERIVGKNRPVIVLTDEPVNSVQLTESPLPNAYLSYPFTSEQLESSIRGTLDKVSSGERLRVSDVEIDVSGFRMLGGPRLTADEIDVLRALSENRALTTENGACIGALNAKLAQLGSGSRIRYIAKKGFEPVTDDE